MLPRVFRRAQKFYCTSNVHFRFYSQKLNAALTSNSIASQQRKKILTYQTASGEQETNQETLIHPAFVTHTNLDRYMGKTVKPVVSITQCENYNLDKVRSDLSLKGIAPIQIVPNECITFKYNQKDIFIFKFGTVVGWNIEENELLTDIIPVFKNAENSTYSYQSEDLDYVELTDQDLKGKNESFVSKDNEIICLNISSPQQKLLDMLAFSYGISRSTRLAILEEAVERHINLSRMTIDKLSKGEKIAVDSKDTLKLSGRLLLLRGKLNLYSELVETPDIYWSESRLEKIHENISNSLDISKRINILNRKLDYLSDEAEALISIISKRTEVNLELIIIYLIVIEVCFEVYHFYDRLGGKYNIEYFRALFH